MFVDIIGDRLAGFGWARVIYHKRYIGVSKGRNKNGVLSFGVHRGGKRVRNKSHTTEGDGWWKPGVMKWSGAGLGRKQTNDRALNPTSLDLLLCKPKMSVRTLLGGQT